MNDKEIEQIALWAVIWPDGKILADSNFRDEAHAWSIALGWPSDEEIEDAKGQGCKARKVKIEIPPE